MAYQRTLAELRGDVQRRSDIQSKLARHPDADVSQYIVESSRAALNMVLLKLKQTFLARLAGTIDRDNSRIPIPEDFVRLHMLLLTDGTTWWQLATCADAEVAMLGNETRTKPVYFRLGIVDDCGAYISLLPQADTEYSYLLFYVPTFCSLASDTSRLDFSLSELFEWIVCDAAQKCCIKDKDAERFQLLGAFKNEAELRLIALAANNVAVISKRRDTRGARRLGTHFPEGWE